MNSRIALLAVGSAATLFLDSTANADIAALWQFDAAGTAQPDATTNANTANALNGAAWLFDGTRNSGVFSFDGSNDRMEALDSASLSITSDITIALWVNVTSAGPFGQWRGLVTKNPTGSNVAGPYQFFFNQANLFPNYVGGNGTSNDVAFSTLDAPFTGVWEHWAVTLSGQNVTIYRNGTPIAMTDSTMTAPIGDAGGPLVIGDRDGPNDMSYHGQLDDIAIFNEVLTQGQVQTIMTGDFTAFGIPEPSATALLLLSAAPLLARRRRASVTVK